MGEKSVTELLQDGVVKINVDPKYPQAIGIATIMRHVSIFGNSPWEILRNDVADSPFFTSDYPAAIEVFDLNTPINRIVPLAPDLAIRVIPDIQLSRAKPDLSFPKFKAAQRQLSRTEVLEINCLLVRCAEDLVLYRDDQEWIVDFVAKNRRYHIEAVTREIPYGTGYITVATQRIVERAE